MNYLDCWFNGSSQHNILFYDANKYIENAFEKCIKQTFPDIIIMYNLYSQNKHEILNKQNQNRSKMVFHFYTVTTINDCVDCGILILSLFPIIIFSNIKYPLNTNRISRNLSLMIRNYEIKIDMDPNEKKDGYLFTVKFTPTNDEIKNSKRKMKKIVLLKREV